MTMWLFGVKTKGVVHKLCHILGRRRVEEFVTVQKKILNKICDKRDFRTMVKKSFFEVT